MKEEISKIQRRKYKLISSSIFQIMILAEFTFSSKETLKKFRSIKLTSTQKEREDYSQLLKCLANLDYKKIEILRFLDEADLTLSNSWKITNLLKETKYIAECKKVSGKFQFGKDGCFSSVLRKWEEINNLFLANVGLIDDLNRAEMVENMIKGGQFENVKANLQSDFFDKSNVRKREREVRLFKTNITRNFKEFGDIFEKKCIENQELKTNNFQCYSILKGKMEKIQSLFEGLGLNRDFYDDFQFYKLFFFDFSALLGKINELNGIGGLDMKTWDSLYKVCTGN